jgi:hypothetical protein
MQLMKLVLYVGLAGADTPAVARFIMKDILELLQRLATGVHVTGSMNRGSWPRRLQRMTLTSPPAYDEMKAMALSLACQGVGCPFARHRCQGLHEAVTGAFDF